MKDFSEFSSEELARACDEYMRRAMNIACDRGATAPVTITISASRYSPTADYDIHHKATIGDYGSSNFIDGNNIIRAMNKLCDRFQDDIFEEPTKVQQLLTTTHVETEIEEAEVEELPSESSLDMSDTIEGEF